MGAKHSGSIGRQIQQVGDAGNSLSREQTKVKVTQSKPVPNIHNYGNRGVAGIGTVYPINPTLDDRETVSDASINIVMTKPTHHYVKINLDNANPTINFTNLLVGVTSILTLDLTNNINLSSLNFSPALSNPPTIDLGIAARNILHIVGHRTASETRYEVVNGSGSGGISFPIVPPVSVRGNVNTTQNIDLSATNAHSTTMTLTGNIAITFSNPPGTGNQIEWEIEITQDGTGGHTITSWPASVVTTPTIDTTEGATTIIVLRTNDGGTLVRTVNSTGGDASGWANFAAVDDIDYNTFDGVNIDRLRFVSDSGVVAAADDPSILLDGSSNMIFNIADQKQWFWTNGSETIMQLNREGVNDDTVLTIETDSTDASAVPRIDIFRDDPSPIINDEFGKLRFIGTDLALASQVYSEIAVEYESVTTGRIASSMIFVTSFDTGATTQFKPFMVINSSNDERIRMIEDVEIVQDIILQAGLDTSKLFFDGGGDTYFTGSASTGRINVVNDNTNTMFFGTDRFELTADRNLIINTGFVRMGERADPTAGVNEGMFYVKDVGGISRPFFIGDGLAAVDLSTGGGGANTSLSNLSAVTVNSDLNLNSGVDVIPLLAGGSNLGTATFPFEKISIKDIEIETGGTFTTSKNNIVSDVTGLKYNTPTGDIHTFFIDGITSVTIREDEIRFSLSGRQHRVVATPSALQLISELQSDTVELWTGASRTNATIEVDDAETIFKTETDQTNSYKIKLLQNHDTPVTNRTIGSLEGWAENSASVDTLYGRVEFSTANSITSGSEDGRVQMEVRSNGSFVPVIEIAGSSVGAKLGFFGVTEVVQQQLDATPTLTEISTLLREYGLSKL